MTFSGEISVAAPSPRQSPRGGSRAQQRPVATRGETVPEQEQASRASPSETVLAEEVAPEPPAEVPGTGVAEADPVAEAERVVSPAEMPE